MPTGYILLGIVAVLVLAVVIARTKKPTTSDSSSVRTVPLDVPQAARAVEAAKPSFVGVPAEVIAAISGAIAAMHGGSARLHSVRPMTRKGAGEWAAAGRAALTEPF